MTKRNGNTFCVRIRYICTRTLNTYQRLWPAESDSDGLQQEKRKLNKDSSSRVHDVLQTTTYSTLNLLFSLSETTRLMCGCL